MGRWRPPTQAASPYITPEGYEALKKELDAIWLRRRDVVAALAEAAAEGDRSENAEYIYRKKELGGIDRRIRYLQKRLPTLNIVRQTPSSDAVFFGATIELEDDDSQRHTYRIVGPDEADAGQAMISLDSPLAKALLKKRVGDVVQLTTEETDKSFNVVAIRYES